jgi:hypothetical protein
MMYRHVHIYDQENLRSLDERISGLSKARGINIWRWVRTLFTDRLDSKKTMTIITRTVNLIEVNLETFVSSQLLVTLRQCCPSLLSLRILHSAKLHETMAQVGLFDHVKHLTIVNPIVEPSRRRPMDPLLLTGVPSWNMPAVTHFSWHDRLWLPLHEATFVSRCRFPHLQHLDICFARPDASLESVPHICRFLDAHRNITSLRMLVRNAKLHLSIVPFVRAQNLQLRGRPRCPWVSLLRSEVKTLEVNLGNYHTELDGDLWALLSQFAAEGETLPTLEKIHLHPEAPGDDDDEDLALTAKEEFLRKLRSSYILPLNTRGIRVFLDDREMWG